MSWDRPGPPRAGRALLLRREVVRSFYRQPIAWFALVVSSAFLIYGGGAVMFWLHAIVRGEKGPAISNVHHWLLDSTLGFVALTPLLAIIVPLAAWRASSDGRTLESGYILAAATVFAVFTGPGPLLHNMVAGAGTPLANLATRWFGEDPAAVHAMHAPTRSPLLEGVLQVCVGLPVYLLCTWLALWFIRLCVRASRHRWTAVEGAADDGVASLAGPV